MRGKIVFIVFMIFLITGSFAGGVLAAEAKGEKSLEEAINIAKKGFAVPAELNEFTSNYNEYGKEANWWLNWSGKKGQMSIEVDAKTGEIIRMHRYSSGEQRGIKLPQLNYQEAKTIAGNVIKKLQPDKGNNLVLKEDEDRPALEINPWGTPRYNFRFQREVEGIPFPNNGVNVAIDGDTGEVLSYNFDWYQGKLTVPSKLLTNEEAQSVFNKEFPLELVYFRPQATDKTDAPAIKLVYQLRQPSHVLIDPVTGKVVKREELHETYDGGAREEMATGAMNKEADLTPEEAKEVTKIEALISKDEAAKKAQQILKLGKEYKLTNSSLQRIWDVPDKIAWQLSWQKTKNGDYQGYASATMDGETGELLNFTLYQYDEDGNKAPIYDKEQSENLAWQLITELQPEKAKEVRLYELDTNRGSKPPRSHRFVYQRLVNGIPFPQNGFEIRVNAVTGQVESYSLRWSQGEFPAPNTVIDEEQATKWYGDEVPLALEFITSYDSSSEETKVKLLYHLRRVPYTMLDGVSGMPLDWNGAPYEKAKPAVFTDIVNHPARADIELLASAGIIEGTADGKFKPDHPITQGELAKMLAKLTEDRGPIIPLPRLALDPDAWHTQWVSDIVGKGLLKEEEVDPEEIVTKEFLATTLVRYLGLEKAAQLTEIYKLRFNDVEAISPQHKGHIAIADGLGIIPAGEKFIPQKQITRAETATALVKALKLD